MEKQARVGSGDARTAGEEGGIAAKISFGELEFAKETAFMKFNWN